MTLFAPVALRRRQAQMFGNSASSDKIDHVPQVQGILNLKGNQNCSSVDFAYRRAACKADLILLLIHV